MKSKIREIITVVVVFVLTALLGSLQPFYALDHMAEDAVYQRADSINKKIKIIKIDEKTMSKYGPTTEWGRDIPGKLVETLCQSDASKPAVVAFDIMYIGDKDANGDTYFASACKNAGNVILASNIVYKTSVDRFTDGVTFVNNRGIEQIEKPYEALLDAGTCAFANTVQDRDGYIRQAQLFVETDDGQLDSLAFAVYKAYQQKNGQEIQIPRLDAYNQTEFTFSGNIADYENVSMCDVLDGTIDPRVFKDCIVLVGAYAPGLMDSFNVAVEKGSQMYGVEVHANIVEALLEGKFSQPANAALCGLIFAMTAVLFYLWIRRKNIVISILSFFVLLAGEILAGILLRGQGYTIPLIYLPVSMILIVGYKVFSQYLIEKINRTRTLNAFKKYVAPQIVEELSKKNNLEIKLGGESRQIAVLFVDIRGFTTMSESLEPEQVVEILNRYLSLTTKAIFDNAGTLDKFVGDATMAVFNAPFDLDDYIFKAVCAAYDIAAGADAIEAEMQERFGKTVGFGVGVNCGPAVVGNIGCDVRMDYTAIGDTVNTAARLEANAKRGQILISEAVYEAVKDRIEVEPVGNIPLKGKTRDVMVYSVKKVKGKEKEL